MSLISSLILTLAIANPNATTPGSVTNLSLQQICSIKWGLDHRFVTIKMKQQVAINYNIDWNQRNLFEFDHLIPRELGGADRVDNLWLQPWADAKLKDKLENKLHKLVCDGNMSLNKARELVKVGSNWR